MVMRILRRIVYFGIPVCMWIAGAACVAEQQHAQQVQQVTFRCSRVGCDKTAVGNAGSPAPTCACGSSMVADSAEDGSPRSMKLFK